MNQPNYMFGPDYFAAQQRVFEGLGIIRPDEYLEYFCYNWEDASIAAGTSYAVPGGYEDTTVRLDQDADFLVMAAMYRATSDIGIFTRLINQSTGQFLFSKECDVSCIAGQAILDSTFGTPTGSTRGWGYSAMKFPSPIRIPGGTAIVAQNADWSGSTNALYLSLHGAKVRRGVAPWLQNGWRKRETFIYTDTIQVPASGVAPLNFSIHQDAHFVCYAITATVQGDATIQIKDGGTDRNWSDRAMRIRNMVGTGRFPHILEAPRMCYINSAITVTLADLSAATNDIRIHLIGEKLYIPGSR